MAEITLVAEPREESGTAVSRRLRAAGRIPGILYGHGVTPVPLSVDARALRSALTTEAGVNVLFELDVAGQRHLAVARELQRHPVRQTVAHVDFQVVRRDEVIGAEVSLNLVGEAPAVTKNGGMVEHLVLTVHVRAKPADIPTSFEIDISELEIGSSLRIADLDVPEGVTIDADPETAVVIGHPPRVQAAEEGEGAEAASEGGAAEAAGGPADEG
ncbi:MAG TPA: 50S ribosomal protein L25 [Acidimicrobiales bacterium]|nr:50S ribosomal protein L25 [Acidimicrobiales bacterium]